MDIADAATPPTGAAEALARDAGRAVAAYTARATTLDDLVDGLIAAFVDAGSRWRRSLAPANRVLESCADYEEWARIVSPSLRAVEEAIALGQERGLVREDLDPQTTALVVRDILDRTVKASVLYGRDGYRRTAAALVCAALRS